jgi:hypothetical protein
VITFQADTREAVVQADLEDIEKLATDLARRAVGQRLRRVQVVPDQDQDGDEFLRVMIEANSLDEVSDDDLINLIEQIEDAVIEKDGRSPSVYFPEAA